jgi:hypothetical protein
MPSPTPAPESPPDAAGWQAQRFLLQVMHDTSAPLALRVQAAQALLGHEPPA